MSKAGWVNKEEYRMESLLSNLLCGCISVLMVNTIMSRHKSNRQKSCRLQPSLDLCWQGEWKHLKPSLWYLCTKQSSQFQQRREHIYCKRSVALFTGTWCGSCHSIIYLKKQLYHFTLSSSTFFKQLNYILIRHTNTYKAIRDKRSQIKSCAHHGKLKRQCNRWLFNWEHRLHVGLES